MTLAFSLKNASVGNTAIAGTSTIAAMLVLKKCRKRRHGKTVQDNTKGLFRRRFVLFHEQKWLIYNLVGIYAEIFSAVSKL
jgi:hypothetical protein